ncbi:hypothetical protein ACFQ6Q_09865 [Streptomyces sp. NPDC056437]|uniref:hypothetical protein n=1 Tax=Streptomyces sp. NPDC056437 TaxID=3345816 RepID=UPI0036833AE4
MALQPVEATLIVGAVGVLTTTTAVVITHRLTLRRDRQHRLWDRRMDTYEEVLRTRRALAQHRAEVLRTQSAKSSIIDPGKELNAFLLTQAQLDMFGSPAIRALDTLSLAAFNHWARLLSEWRDLHARAISHFNNQEMYDEADERWAELVHASKSVDLADRRLSEVIRDEAEFKQFRGPNLWQRLATKLQHFRPRRRQIERGEGTSPKPSA